jgi:hypothetical protein
LHIQYRDVLDERRMLLRKAAEAELEFQLQLIDLDATPQAPTLARRAARPLIPAAAGGDAAEAPADQPADSPADEASDENDGNGGEPPAPWHRWHPAAKAYDRYQATQKGLKQQIESLDAEVAEIEEQILDQSAANMALAPLEDEIRRYERLVNEMGERLLRWDVELAAPNRVRIVQNAVLQPADQRAKEGSARESGG